MHEEKLKSACGDWNEVEGVIPNSDLKLYGGAQYERLLSEFGIIANSIVIPETSESEIASAIGKSSRHTLPDIESAVSDLVQIKSRQCMIPLIDVVLQRCSFIMKNLFEIVISHMHETPGHNCTSLTRYSSVYYFYNLTLVC